MDVSVTRTDDATIVKPSGPIDSLTADALQDALLAVIGERKGRVELRFSEVHYLSSAGLRVLVMAAKALRETGRRLELTGVQAQVMTVLSVANFTSFIDVQPA